MIEPSHSLVGGEIITISANRSRPEFARITGHRRLAILALLFLLTLSLAACGQKKRPGAGDGRPTYGGTINYFLGEPVAIDPAFVQDSDGIEVAKALFDGLVDYDPKTLALRPAVATRWSANKAGDEWTFWLRRDAKFHNKRAVTAADFAWSWARVAAKKTASPTAYHLAPVKGFDAVQKGKSSRLSGVTSDGKYILKVKLNYPFSDFPMILGHPVFSPVPKEALKGGNRAFSDQPVGNGPFSMDGPWRHDQGITLKKFAGYHGAEPYLDGVNFKIFNNKQTGFLEFTGGGLDYSPIPSGQIKVAVEQFGANAVVGRPQLILNFFGINVGRPPFKNNIKLRQAIGYAVNRRAVVANVYQNAYLAAGSIVPPAMPDYKRPANSYTFSPAKAKRLLKEAGYTRGKGLPALKLLYPAGEGYEEPAQMVQADLGDLGVKVDLEGLEFGAFLEAVGRGRAPLFAASWQADYPIRDTFLYQLFYSKSGDNVFGFADKKVDRLLISARRELNAAKRVRLFDQAEAEILKKAPLAPLAYAGTSLVHSARVKGFIRTGLDDTPLDRVWLSKE